MNDSVEEYIKRIDESRLPTPLTIRKDACYYHCYENFYTMSDIDKMRGMMRREAFPEGIVLQAFLSISHNPFSNLQTKAPLHIKTAGPLCYH